MGVASYAAMAERKSERSHQSALLVSGLLSVTVILLFLRWWITPPASGTSPWGYLYPAIYLSMLSFCVVVALFLQTTRWRWLPLIHLLGVLTFAISLNWADLHGGTDLTVFTIALFAVGVIFSASPLGYLVLLGGAAAVFLLLVGQTLPERLAQIDLVVQAVILALSYAGALMLESQRRQADEMAVRLQDANDQLRETSFRDPLTGLYNRRFLVEFLEGKRALSARLAIPLSVVLLDLDHFKRINDSLGHAVGDLVLRATGRSLLEGIRESDLAARYGGEEFVLILPQALERDAARVTVRILERLRKTKLSGVPWPVTFSAGVAQLAAGESIEALLERADKRLYAAKRRRNLVVSWG